MKITFCSRNPLNPVHGFHAARFKGKMCLTLGPGEAFIPGTPQEWKASNGVMVKCDPSGWNGSFHDAEYSSSLAWAGAEHRHIGPARRALIEFYCKFITSAIVARAELRRMIRPGD